MQSKLKRRIILADQSPQAQEIQEAKAEAKKIQNRKKLVLQN